MYSGERILPRQMFNVTYQQSLVAYELASTYGQGKHVLDVACGEGYGSSVLATKAARVVGVDYNRAAVSAANKRYGSSNLSFVEGDLDSLSEAVGGEKFDVVCCFQTIEHIQDHDRFIAALQSVVKPGGQILVSTPNKEMFPTFNPYHVHELNKDEMNGLFEAHFSTFELLGVFGSERVMSYRQEKQWIADWILRIDFLSAREWLPHWLLKIIYGLLSFFVIKRISWWKHQSEVQQITTNDFSVKKEGLDKALDFIAVATYDGRVFSPSSDVRPTNKLHTWGLVLLLLALFLPRMIQTESFFTQDEQPWMDRAMIYSRAIGHWDLDAAAEFPLSNHPAITLMTTVGPVLHAYTWYNEMEGTYADWSWPVRREAAIVARYAWGIVCSIVLLLLYVMVRRLRVFAGHPWQPAVLVVLFGLEPWIWGISRAVSVDVMMGICLVGSFVAGMIAREQKKPIWFFLGGVWWAAAFISKSPSLIVAPFVFLLPILLPWRQWREMVWRASLWVVGMYVAAIIIWPPFFVHPIQRITDVIARDALHATMPEPYLMPNTVAPFFLIALSAFAFVGCILYVIRRVLTWKKEGWQLLVFDVLLVAGLWHGAILVYLQGDHARKNLPAIALLAVVGAMGWILLGRSLMESKEGKKHPVWIWGAGLVILQLLLVGPYFPHVISAHNFFLATPESLRLLVDIGNGSRLLADYISSHDDSFVYATGMDSLMSPYLTEGEREQLAELPEAGNIKNLPGEVTHVVVSMSSPARAQFDRAGLQLWEDTQQLTPEAILAVRDVPMFAIYRIAK